MRHRHTLLTLLAAFLLCIAGTMTAHARDWDDDDWERGHDRGRHRGWHKQVRPEIDRLSVRAANGQTAVPGQTVIVLMRGTPGGTATFDLHRVQNRIPMTEVQSGRYQGSFVVPNLGERTLHVHAHLTINGRTASEDAHVALATAYTPGYPYGPTGYNPGYPYGQQGQVYIRVTAPVPGQAIGNDFTVTGNTLPYAQVQVTARLQQQLVPGWINIGTQQQSASGVADAYGNFAIPVHFNSPSLGSGRNVNLKVVATDPRTAATREVEYNIATSY